MERETAERYGLKFAPVNSRKLPGKNPVDFASFGLKTGLNVISSMRFFASVKPAAVIGFGGYVSFPGVVSAILMKIPVFLQEQNVVPGKVNRLLSDRAKTMFTSFAKTGAFVRCSSMVTGNPTRFEGRPRPSVDDARKRLGLEPGRLTLLVFGGSQGAASINLAAIDFAEMEKSNAKIQMLHLTGKKNYDEVREEYENRQITGENDGLRVVALPYFEEMDLAYTAADLVLCRAGATAIAEIMEFGKPSILVPYPHAAEAHQKDNAEYLVERGAAIMVDDGQLTGEKVAETLRALNVCEKNSSLAAMAAACGGLYIGNASARIVDEISSLVMDT